MKTNKKIVVGTSFAASLLAAGLLVAPAMAAYGVYQGQSLQGYFNYSWTKSYAEGTAPNGFVQVEAKQDGVVAVSRAGMRGGFRRISNTGLAKNKNDSARAFVYRY